MSKHSLQNVNQNAEQNTRPEHLNDPCLFAQYCPYTQLCLPVLHSSMSTQKCNKYRQCNNSTILQFQPLAIRFVQIKTLTINICWNNYTWQNSLHTICTSARCKKKLFCQLTALHKCKIPPTSQLFYSQRKGSVKKTEHLNIFLFSTHHSMVFYFWCSIYWWKESVRFYCFKILVVKN